jgi:hypothetical protein
MSIFQINASSSDNRGLENSTRSEVCSRTQFPKELKMYEAFPWEIFRKDKHLNDVYVRILKNNVDPIDFQWITKNLNSKEATAFHHTVEGDLVRFWGCKPHECDSEQLVVIFNPKTKKIVIEIIEMGKAKVFGNLPSRIVSECLDKDSK